MNKTIAIYFSDQNPMGYPFDKPEYFEKYQEVIAELEKREVQVFVVRGSSYLGSGRFKNGWKFFDGKLQESSGEIKAALIFNRDDKNTIPEITDCKIINHPELDKLCVDKLKTFEMFPDISPKTATINSYEDFLNIIKAWELGKNELVVLKKNFETEGRGIFILPITEINRDLYDDWSNILFQEFLDSSIGLPGIAEGLHDLRITVVNGKPINSFVRQPQAGSYLANLSQGGQGLSIELEQVPDEILAITKQIGQKLEKFLPSLYAADFMNTNKGYKLIELNSRPGIQHPNWSGSYQKFNTAVVEMLLGATGQ